MKSLSLYKRSLIWIYVSIYLLTCYVKWEIYNPIEPLLQLPNMTSDDRFFFLFGRLFWVGLIHLITWVFTTPIKQPFTSDEVD